MKSTYSYQLGADIFVAPVLDETGTVSLDFPEGTWVYAFDTTQTFEEGPQGSMTVAMNEYPLFFRADSAVGDTIQTSLAGD